MRNLTLFSFLGLLFLAIAGCGGTGQNQSPESATENVPVQNGLDRSSMGGIDSSGGETPRSHAELIQKTVYEQVKILPLSFHRLKTLMDEVPEILERQEELKKPIKSNLIGWTMQPGQDEYNKHLLTFDDQTISVLDSLFPQKNESELFEKIKTMHFEFQEEPCIGEFKDPRDMSITSEGKVCVSFARMSRIPPQHLEIQVLALLSMEASHLMGYDRTQATFVRDWFLQYPNVVAANQDEFERLQNLLDEVIVTFSSLIHRAGFYGQYKSDAGYETYRNASNTKELIVYLFAKNKILFLPKLLENKIFKLLDHKQEKFFIPHYSKNMENFGAPEFIEKAVEVQNVVINIKNELRNYQDSKLPYRDLHWLSFTNHFYLDPNHESIEADDIPDDGSEIQCKITDLVSKKEWVGKAIESEEDKEQKKSGVLTLKFTDEDGENLGHLHLDTQGYPLQLVLAFVSQDRSENLWSFEGLKTSDSLVRFTSHWQEKNKKGDGPSLSALMDYKVRKAFSAQFKMKNSVLSESRDIEITCFLEESSK